jgi:cytochrome c556
VTTVRLCAAALAAAALALLAGCSNGDDSAGSDRAASTAATTSVTSVVVTAPIANADTIDACRSLATNEPLKQFWHEMNNGGTVMGTLAVEAGLAVMNLGRYASDPDLDADVAAVMSNAVKGMGDMNQERAGGASFDVEQFRDIITPIVTQCQAAGVDMAVPD